MRKTGFVVLIVFVLALFPVMPVYAQDSIDTQIANNNTAGIKARIAKNYEEAINCFTKSIDLDPNNVEPILWRSECYYRLNNYDMSLKDLDLVLSLNPKNYEALYDQACIFNIMKDQNAALNSLQLVLAMDPNYKARAIVDHDFGDIINTERFRTLTGITVRIDGNVLASNTSPVVVDNRTLVPLRSIFEALGVEVEWAGDTNTISCTRGTTSISLQLNNKEAQVNGKTVTLDTPAATINDRTYVPVRFIAEALGATVNWQDDTQEVLITSPDDNTGIVPADEKGIMEKLKQNWVYCPIDGAGVEPYNLNNTQGLAMFVIKTQEELQAFQSLNDTNKKELLNNYVQSRWSDFIGCQEVRIYLIYNGKRYAETSTGFETQSGDLNLYTFKQGIDTNVVIQDKDNSFYYDYYINKKPIFNRANVKNITDNFVSHDIYFNGLKFATMSYPKTWQVFDQNQMVLFVSPLEGNNDLFADNINLHIAQMPPDMMDKLNDPNACLDYLKKQAANTLTDLKIETAKLDLKQERCCLYEIVYTCSLDQAQLKGKSYALIDTSGFVLCSEVMAEQKNFDDFDQIFEAMLDTLEFVKSPDPNLMNT